VEEEGYSTAEAATIEDVPARYVEVIGHSIAPDGNHAVYLLSLNEEPIVDLYLQPCYRDKGQWHPGPRDWGASPEGSGRAAVTFGRSRPTALIIDGPAPPDATEAVIEFDGEQHRIPVSGGHYLFVAWDPGDPAADVVARGFA
jgi:hypothetical protein